MKLNIKGTELYDKWMDIWDKEVERIWKEEPHLDPGWYCIDNDSFVKNIEDQIGIALVGDDDDAIYHILEWYRPNDPYAFGYTAAEVVEMMKPYFDIDPDEDLAFTASQIGGLD